MKPVHRVLANAIAAIKPEWSEWNVGEESKQAWKDFVRGFQSGELIVTARSSIERSGCPCTVEGIEPCRPQCTCANSFMSGGCSRCARYGSLEQQQRHARYIVAAVSATGPNAEDTARLDWLQSKVVYRPCGAGREASVESPDVDLEAPLIESEGDLRKAIDSLRAYVPSEGDKHG